MPFKTDLPDYQLYHDTTEYYLKSIPASVWQELEGLIIRASDDAGTLKGILNEFSAIIPALPTNNWGYNFLQNDISYFMSMLRKKVNDGHIYKFFDCVAVLVGSGSLSVDEINEFLGEHNIGYVLYRDTLTNKLIWNLANEDAASAIEDITAAQEASSSVSQQAYEEFERAKKSLEDAADERARKDAVRSCASAMEAVVKEYGNDNDIKQASKNLRSSKIWGIDDIVKQGDAIFNTLHRLYPDLRHGSTESSSMSIEEAEYWIGRISVYLQYMKKMAEKNGIQ